MQPRTCQVGPLAAPSVANIAVSQTATGAGALALTGTTTLNTVANNVCLSQAGTAATALLLNGALCRARYSAPTMNVTSANVAYIPNPSMVRTASQTTNLFESDQGQPITITSAGNDSAITFSVVGVRANPSGLNATFTETVRGTNAGISSTLWSYILILSITPSGNTAANVTVGTSGMALLDTARRVLITSAGNDSGITFTITGLDWSGQEISEVLTGGNAAAVYSVLDYLGVLKIVVSGATASTVTVGTNGVASSQWVNLDTWAGGTVATQCVVSGTVNYTVQLSNDDPNSYGNPVARSAVTWDGTAAGSNVTNATTNQTWAGIPVGWARVLLNSNTNPGYVRMTLVQHLNAPA